MRASSLGQDKQKMLLEQDVGHFSMIRYVYCWAKRRKEDTRNIKSKAVLTGIL